MAEIVLFHSILGVRPGVNDAAERFRSAGHTVHVADLYRGEVFDDYEAAEAYLEDIGGPATLIERTDAAVANLPATLVYAGFSNGGASAIYLTASRPGALGTLAFHSALPLEEIGMAPTWPASAPVQVHYAENDPWREQDWIDRYAATVRESGASYEFHEYPGVTGHLFTDRSLPGEYDSAAAELLFERALAFVERVAN